MPTLIPFTPNVLAPFAFQPALDGQNYNASVPWNVWGQRWYLSLLAPSGGLVVYTALVASQDPIGGSITTMAGLANAVITPTSPVYNGFSVSSVNVPDGTTITDITPNGYVRLSQPAIASGTDTTVVFDFVVDLIAGFGFTSTLVFRDYSQNFEIDP